ncbi:MAG: hypothetical protein WC332_10000, partial [Clostridia bacterium]
MNLGWDTIKQLLKKAWTWTGIQTFTSLIATTADINGGTIDGATIGASSATTGKFTTLQVTTGAVNGYVLQSNAAGLLSYADPAASANAGLYSLVNPKAYSQGVALTASAAVGGIQHPDDDDIDFGTGNFGHIVGVNLADYSPATDTILYQKHDGTNGYIFKLLTTGYLRLTINATSYDSTATVGSAGATDGYGVSLGFSTTRETAAAAGSVLFEINGAQLGSSVAITAGAPTTVSNAVSGYTMGTSSTRYAGIVYYSIPLNFAPTADEHKSAFKNGIPESWKWGSQTNEFISVDADIPQWSVDQVDTGNDGNDRTTFATNYSGATFSGGCTDISVASGVLTFTAAASERLNIGSVISSEYKNYELIVNITSMTGQWYVRQRVNSSVGNLAELTTGTNVIRFTTSASGENRIYFVNTSDSPNTIVWDASVVPNSLKPMGATLALEPANIQPVPGMWLDSSTNNLPAIYPASGV